MVRPSRLTTLAVVSLVLGTFQLALDALRLGNTLGTLAPPATTQPIPSTSQPFVATVSSSAALLFGVASFVDLLLCVALIIAGLGVLAEKRWARNLHLTYAVLALPVGLLLAYITYAIKGAPEGRLAVGSLGGSLASSLIFPALVLFVLSRPDVKQHQAAVTH